MSKTGGTEAGTLPKYRNDINIYQLHHHPDQPDDKIDTESKGLGLG